MRGRPGIPYGEPIAQETIRALHQAHIDGFGWMQIARNCDVHIQTLYRAMKRGNVTRETRERIERFAKKHKARAA